MSQKMHKFPSIEQFRSVIREVNHRARFIGRDADTDEPIYNEGEVEMPTLDFRGSVKLHGTNAAIVYTWNPLAFDYEFHAQSRKNIITPVKDNAGFAAFAHTRNTEALLAKVMKAVGDLGYTPEVVKIFGEWCGGNIQKGVALNGLDKMFVIFAIKVDKTWLTESQLMNVSSHEEGIYNVLDYTVYRMSIDFNKPEEAVNKMVDLTIAVEEECPVGRAFLNDVMLNNTAYEEDGKIWFDRENKFTNEFKSVLKSKFDKLREDKPNGINYIKFSLHS